MNMSFAQAVVELVSISDEEISMLNSEASHCCPNCDGPITNSEHKYLGICSSCYSHNDFSLSQLH